MTTKCSKAFINQTHLYANNLCPNKFKFFNMRKEKQFQNGLSHQFSGIIILGVNCKNNQSELNLQPNQLAEYLTRKEVSNLFQVNERTVYNWTKNRKLKAVRFGHRVFFESHKLNLFNNK